VQCDGCDEWYHPECVGTTLLAVEAMEAWHCPLCVRRMRHEKGGRPLTKRQQAAADAAAAAAEAAMAAAAAAAAAGVGGGGPAAAAGGMGDTLGLQGGRRRDRGGVKHEGSELGAGGPGGYRRMAEMAADGGVSAFGRKRKLSAAMAGDAVDEFGPSWDRGGGEEGERGEKPARRGRGRAQGTQAASDGAGMGSEQVAGGAAAAEGSGGGGSGVTRKGRQRGNWFASEQEQLEEAWGGFEGAGAATGEAEGVSQQGRPRLGKRSRDDGMLTAATGHSSLAEPVAVGESFHGRVRKVPKRLEDTTAAEAAAVAAAIAASAAAAGGGGGRGAGAAGEKVAVPADWEKRAIALVKEVAALECGLPFSGG
jgi:hypothetical protein